MSEPALDLFGEPLEPAGKSQAPKAAQGRVARTGLPPAVVPPSPSGSFTSPHAEPHLTASAATASVSTKAARVLPDVWSKLIASVPMPFREVILEGAWDIHDRVLDQVMADTQRVRGAEHNSAVTTAMGHVSYAMFLPYHLVQPEQMPKSLALLREDTHKFLMWTKQAFPNADRLLVVGDSPHAEHMALKLDKQLSDHPAETLVCGPGQGVESILMDFGRARNYVNFHMTSVDHEAGGASWNQVPGPKLDGLIARLFNELKPDRVMAFDPVQMPATLEVLNQARKRGLPVLFVEASTEARPTSLTARRRARP